MAEIGTGRKQKFSGFALKLETLVTIVVDS
jgi:hypothetical protein